MAALQSSCRRAPEQTPVTPARPPARPAPPRPAPQARLSRAMPFCFSQLLGSHNSGISLANGYGNLDPYFQGVGGCWGAGGCWVLGTLGGRVLGTLGCEGDGFLLLRRWKP